MKINILYDFKDGPYGGGNQFLKGLKKEFEKQGIYEDNPYNSDVVLFNSFEIKSIKLLYKLKKKNKILVHRVDGPISKYRGRDTSIDNKIKELDKDLKIYFLNNLFADGTIFQSMWSRRENYKLGMKRKNFETVIMNAPDPLIFNKKGKIGFSKKRKIKLIATSWSSNWNKGFEIYKWLDENLDFAKYEMTFVGDSPIGFKNIRHISPLKSVELAKELKKNDIYITASKKDPCSNSLIEAMHCGLPAIGFNDGGHPEIIKKGGELFNGPEEIPILLKKIEKNYKKYIMKIDVPSINKIGENYYNFVKKVYKGCEREDYNYKVISIFQIIHFKFSLVKMKIIDKIKRMLKRT